MRLTLLLVLTCVLGAAPVRADAPAPRPRDKGASPATDPSSIRRTGRVPAVIEVTPRGSTTPTHMVVTIPRDRLKGVVTPLTAGGVGPVANAPDDQPGVTRNVVAAGFLALAILSVPVLWGGRRRRGAAAVAVVLALAAATTLVRADIAAPRPRPPPPAPASSSTPATSQGGTPQTVEVVLVPGSGPIHVQVTYGRP